MATIILLLSVTTSVSAQMTVPVGGVSISPTTMTLTSGETANFPTVTISPSAATNKSVTWTTSDKKIVAIVTETKGKTTIQIGIRAGNAGTATLTVITADGGFTATCEVTVTAVVSVMGVSVNPTTMEITSGEIASLPKVNIKPQNATNQAIQWTTSDNSIVAIVTTTDKITGKTVPTSIRAVGVGTATITVTTADGGHTATCVVTVKSATVAPVITTTSLPDGTVGFSYSQLLTATGTSPIKWSYSNLPPGLILEQNSGILSGTPTKGGTYNATIIA
ncbi:MAG: Ig-like domain-containing protein, partial [Tannerella sp.]|nr:Ig-like domain-containing protein [Tannerella sp.]